MTALDPGGPHPISAERSSDPAVGVQTSLDDLGTPLREVTFCVVDLETTGGRASDLGITEIGAVKVRAGEVLAEFGSLVNPGMPIPAFVSVLTGITDAAVAGAPKLGSILPSFLEFATNTVLVAHNAPYDTGYLKAASCALGYQWPDPPVLDTAVLARRALPRGEVPNHKLGTLAQHFHAGTRPNHRALDDARATVDVLHGLLERVGASGVDSLEELLGYSGKVADAQRRKRHLAEGLPRAPGVYLFTDDRGETLYVGTSRNIRARVRTYFTASERRSRMAEMVALATGVTPIVCASPLEAQVRELRLIAERKPRYNKRSRHPERATWLKLTDEAAPRLSAVRTLRETDTTSGRYIGPMSAAAAAAAAEAVAFATGLRTCTPRLSVRAPRTPCAQAELGRCEAPCAGESGMLAYRPAAELGGAALSESPALVTDSILTRVAALSAEQRYEDAGEWLRRLHHFLRGADRARQHQGLGQLSELVAAEPAREGGWDIHVIRYGRLAGAAHAPPRSDPRHAVSVAVSTAEAVNDPVGSPTACLPEETDLILRWLARPGVRLVRCSEGWASPVTAPAGELHRLEELRLPGHSHDADDGPSQPVTD